MLWMIGEDFLDVKVIRRLEDRTASPVLRALLRSGLNPSRSFANALRWKPPWYRDDRPFRQVHQVGPAMAVKSGFAHPPSKRLRPPLQFSASASYHRFQGKNRSIMNCIGGLGSIEFSPADRYSLLAEAGGCKAFDAPALESADMLSFLVGPRLYPAVSKRWNSYIEILAGVQRITIDRHVPVAPETRSSATRRLLAPFATNGAPHAMFQSDGFALAAGGGVEMVINRALALRVADLRYSYAWTGVRGPASYSAALRVSTGLMMRLGTW
jgi:hypothetical protein